MLCYISGHKGLIGSCLSRKLREKRHTVYTSEGIIDENFSIPFEGIDWVFSMAGSTGGIRHITNNEQKVISNNLNIDKIMLDRAIACGVKRIFYPSSACVYPFIYQGENFRDLSEMDDWPLQPDTMYGLEKAFMERYYLSFKNKIDVRVGRLFSTFGEQHFIDQGKEKFIPAIARKVLEATDKVEILGTGHELRDIIYVEDCADAIIKFMESDLENEIINISDKPLRIIDVADYLINYSGKDLKIKTRGDIEIGVKNRVADLSKLRKKLKFSSNVGVWKGLEKTYDYIKELTSGK